jgi:alcohol dehydrogenase class IV
MAHKTGAVFHIPHGCANAIYLPYVIDFNKKDALDRYAQIAKRLGLAGTSDNELVDSLTSLIKELNKKMGIPTTLKEYGIDEVEFNSKVDMVAERAIADACTGSNPRQLDKEEMKKLFECIYYGNKVEF